MTTDDNKPPSPVSDDWDWDWQLFAACRGFHIAIIAEAVTKAAGADVAVVVVGLTEEQETEAVDKDTLRLPGDQDALVFAIAAAALRTVVVVNAATLVLMPWLDKVDAALWAGLPGQEAGHAGPVAAVEVTNTGRRASREVVQVYLEPEVHPRRSPVSALGPAHTFVGRHRRRGRLLVASGLGDIRAT